MQKQFFRGPNFQTKGFWKTCFMCIDMTIAATASQWTMVSSKNLSYTIKNEIKTLLIKNLASEAVQNMQIDRAIQFSFEKLWRKVLTPLELSDDDHTRF